MDDHRKLDIAYVTAFDSRSVDLGWSGTGYHIPLALERQGHRVHRVQACSGRLRNHGNVLRMFLRWTGLGGKHVAAVDPNALRALAESARSTLKALDYDVVLGCGYFPLCYLDETRPVVMWGDATFAVLHGYHPAYRKLNRCTVRNWENAERRVQERSKLLVYASQWAADSAVADYGTSPDKVLVVPFGANLDIQFPLPDADEALRVREPLACRLLLVGRDWYWKGVDIACDVVDGLRRQGVNATLDVVGCQARPDTPPSPYLRFHGYSPKSNPATEVRLHELYKNSHFLIHPSRAECYGVVMCEANAHALPVIANRTGGIPEIIAHGENGFLIDDNRPDGYIRVIQQLLKDREMYRRHCSCALHAYRSRLNWDACACRLLDALRRVAVAPALGSPTQNRPPTR